MMLLWDWSQLLGQLRALGLQIESVDEATGRVVVKVPEIGADRER